ncbi:MAG: hypothetical protein ABI182_05740, partial [Candidatus Baltobacteraceae bacterium]
GISPTQRYAFQDQVALSLRCYLNALEQRSGSPLTWNTVIHWPQLDKQQDVAALRASALRLYRSDDNPANPVHAIYDVYEGYWSPLSKGKTNIASAAKWLLNATFLATSSTANIPCTPKKLRSDLQYVGLLLGFVVLIAAVALVLAAIGWVWFAGAIAPGKAGVSDLAGMLFNPLATIAKLPAIGYVELALDVAAAYLLAQLFVLHRVSSTRTERTSELRADAQAADSTFKSRTIAANVYHRWASILLWSAFLVVAVLAVVLPVGFQHLTWWYALSSAIVAGAVLLFQGARAIADFAVENVFGDVQVYTTHDNNSAFYAIRQQIVQTVCTALIGVLMAADDSKSGAPEPYYDDLHIFGHSLGSTVGMDSLIFVRQMVQEGALKNAHWGRIRSFTTFGTSLEKTRFFFDVRQPTINAAQDQWENDVYGRFFTDDPSVLTQPDNRDGIYWNNLWYFRDIVANEIVSYASDVPAGSPFLWAGSAAPRKICDNRELFHEKVTPWAWVHSDYLSDTLFWDSAGPTVTSS